MATEYIANLKSQVSGNAERVSVITAIEGNWHLHRISYTSLDTTTYMISSRC